MDDCSSDRVDAWHTSTLVQFYRPVMSQIRFVWGLILKRADEWQLKHSIVLGGGDSLRKVVDARCRKNYIDVSLTPMQLVAFSLLFAAILSSQLLAQP